MEDVTYEVQNCCILLLVLVTIHFALHKLQSLTKSNKMTLASYLQHDTHSNASTRQNKTLNLTNSPEIIVDKKTRNENICKKYSRKKRLFKSLSARPVEVVPVTLPEAKAQILRRRLKDTIPDELNRKALYSSPYIGATFRSNLRVPDIGLDVCPNKIQQTLIKPNKKVRFVDDYKPLVSKTQHYTNNHAMFSVLENHSSSFQLNKTIDKPNLLLPSNKNKNMKQKPDHNSVLKIQNVNVENKIASSNMSVPIESLSCSKKVKFKRPVYKFQKRPTKPKKPFPLIPTKYPIIRENKIVVPTAIQATTDTDAPCLTIIPKVTTRGTNKKINVFREQLSHTDLEEKVRNTEKIDDNWKKDRNAINIGSETIISKDHYLMGLEEKEEKGERRDEEILHDTESTSKIELNHKLNVYINEIRSTVEMIKKNVNNLQHSYDSCRSETSSEIKNQANVDIPKVPGKYVEFLFHPECIDSSTSIKNSTNENEKPKDETIIEVFTDKQKYSIDKRGSSTCTDVILVNETTLKNNSDEQRITFERISCTDVRIVHKPTPKVTTTAFENERNVRLICSRSSSNRDRSTEKKNRIKHVFVGGKNKMKGIIKDCRNKIKQAIGDGEEEIKHAIEDDKHEVKHAIDDGKDEIKHANEDSKNEMTHAIEDGKDRIKLAIEDKMKDAIQDDKDEMKHTIEDGKDKIKLAIEDDKDEMKHAIEDDKDEMKHTIEDDKDEMKNTIEDDKVELKHAIEDDKDEMKNTIEDDKVEVKHAIEDDKDEMKDTIKNDLGEVKHVIKIDIDELKLAIKNAKNEMKHVKIKDDLKGMELSIEDRGTIMHGLETRESCTMEKENHNNVIGCNVQPEINKEVPLSEYCAERNASSEERALDTMTQLPTTQLRVIFEAVSSTANIPSDEDENHVQISFPIRLNENVLSSDSDSGAGDVSDLEFDIVESSDEDLEPRTYNVLGDEEAGGDLNALTLRSVRPMNLTPDDSNDNTDILDNSEFTNTETPHNEQSEPVTLEQNEATIIQRANEVVLPQKTSGDLVDLNAHREQAVITTIENIAVVNITTGVENITTDFGSLATCAEKFTTDVENITTGVEILKNHSSINEDAGIFPSIRSKEGRQNKATCEISRVTIPNTRTTQSDEGTKEKLIPKNDANIKVLKDRVPSNNPESKLKTEQLLLTCVRLHHEINSEYYFTKLSINCRKGSTLRSCVTQTETQENNLPVKTRSIASQTVEPEYLPSIQLARRSSRADSSKPKPKNQSPVAKNERKQIIQPILEKRTTFRSIRATSRDNMAKRKTCTNILGAKTKVSILMDEPCEDDSNVQSNLIEKSWKTKFQMSNSIDFSVDKTTKTKVCSIMRNYAHLVLKDAAGSCRVRNH